MSCHCCPIWLFGATWDRLLHICLLDGTCLVGWLGYTMDLPGQLGARFPGLVKNGMKFHDWRGDKMWMAEWMVDDTDLPEYMMAYKQAPRLCSIKTFKDCRNFFWGSHLSSSLPSSSVVLLCFLCCQMSLISFDGHPFYILGSFFLFWQQVCLLSLLWINPCCLKLFLSWAQSGLLIQNSSAT